ncbi:MAG: dTDP-4-dehydrorhamnose 3,5-epimerase [Pseudomonadota bacterium]
MDIEETSLPGVAIITPRRFSDERGYFSETWNLRTWGDTPLPEITWVQENQSMSASKGTLRGLHYQTPPHAQAKLVRCAQGALWDVAVDARKRSATFGRWVGVELSAENGRQLLIPEGFLHGFVTLTDDTLCLYKCSNFYAPEADGTVAWDSCGIDWPEISDEAGPKLSGKDASAPAWSNWESPF